MQNSAEKTNNNMAPQEVVTIFCEIKTKSDKEQWVEYPQLRDFFERGYYIEKFNQTLIGDNRYMITFSFRKFNVSFY